MPPGNATLETLESPYSWHNGCSRYTAVHCHMHYLSASLTPGIPVLDRQLQPTSIEN
jgi:hypothetical protein